LGDKHRGFFRHASNDRTEDRASNGIDNKPGTDGQQPFQRINDAYVVDWITTVSPTFILNGRASFNRFIEKGYGSANAGFDVTSFGFPASLISTLPSPVYFGRFNFYTGNSGTTTQYNPLGRGQSNNYSNTYEIAGSATKILGSHTLKGGFDIRQINYLQQNTGDILRFDSYTAPTSQIYNQPDGNSGDPFATFLLGIPQGNSNYPLFPWWKQWYAAPYFQDDWKVTRRLTLNLGLRLDFNFGASEKWNRMNGPFDPTVASPVAGQISAENLALYPQLRNLKGSLTFAGVNGIGSTPARLNKNNWQPRFGAAFQVNERMVLRGGGGIYFSNPNNDYFQTAGFSTNTDVVNSLDDRRTFIPNVLSNPYPNGVGKPTGSSLGPLTFNGRNNNWFDSNFKTPKVWMYSFGIQYQVTQASTLDVSYVGSHSTNLNMQKDYNIPSLDFRKQCNLQEGGSPLYCDAAVPNPFKGIESFKGTNFYTANTISRFQANRPFPQFDGLLIQQGRNDAILWYNSLQFNYNFRFRAGLNLLGNYTISKQVERANFNDPYNNVYQQGLYLLDRPQVIKLTAIYDLPFGQGKHWGAGSTGLVKKLISGWTATTFLTDPLKGFPSDLPSNVIQLKDTTTPGGGWDGTTDWKANQVRLWSPCVLRQFNDGSIAPQPYSLAKGCGTDVSTYPWMQTASYAPRYTPFRSGQIRRHHAVQVDASILKSTQITERIRAQFGVEAFNLLNHNYFGRDQVQQDPTNPNFGTIFPSQVSTQNILPRQLQIRMKITW
jgi:opacity protein-like surface antigen